MNDYYPTDTIDVTTHTLERAQEYGCATELSVFLYPEVYGTEFAIRELVKRHAVEVSMRARSLYSYTRFEDERLTVKSQTWDVRHERRLAEPRDHIKHRLFVQWNKLRVRNQRWNREHAARCGDKPYKCYLPKFPKRLEPKWELLQIASCRNEEKNIERIQESLLAQIALFYKYNLKPQAVLAHPEMASVLAAARTMDERYYQRAVTINGRSSFAGLPVVACPELAQGAMVV